MSVPLNKKLTRWVKIGGEDYKLVLEPPTRNNVQAQTQLSLWKKQAHQDMGRASLEEIKEWLETRHDTVASRQDQAVRGLRSLKGRGGTDYHNNIAYKDLLSRIGALHIDLANQLRDIVDDIYEVNCLASDLSDEELIKKGINPDLLD